MKRPISTYPFPANRLFSANWSFSANRSFSAVRSFSPDRPFSPDQPFSADRPFSVNRPFSANRPFSTYFDLIFIFSVPTTVYQKPLGQIFLKDSANKTFVIQRQKQVPNDSKVQMQHGPSGPNTVHSGPQSNSGPEVRTLSQGPSGPHGQGSHGPGQHGQPHGQGSNSGQPTVTAYESSGYQKQPTRLTSNGTNYEIKGIPSSQSTYSNDQRPHVLSVFPRKSIIQVKYFLILTVPPYCRFKQSRLALEISEISNKILICLAE